MEDKKAEEQKKAQAAKKAAEHEANLQRIFAKINREWPVRCKLANLAGFKANPKNDRALMDTDFDLTIHELYLEVLFRKPENAEEALKIIRSMYEEKK